eukprot:Awhi_evm1s14696
MKIVICLFFAFFLQNAFGIFVDEDLDSNLRMNQIMMIGTHNSYHVRPDRQLNSFYELFEEYLGTNSAPAFDYSHVNISTQLREQGVRCLELDIGYDPNGDLYGTHATYQVLLRNQSDPNPKYFEPGYKAFHVQDVDFSTNCVLFTDCLQEIKSFLDEFTQSVPIHVLLEMRTPEVNTIEDPLFLGFAVPITPDLAVLQQEILSVFDRGDILTPADVMNYGGRKTPLQTKITEDGWPLVNDVRGKVVFWMTSDVGYTLAGDATGLLFPVVNAGEDEAAVLVIGNPEAVSQSLLNQNYIIRTRSDVETAEARSGDATRRDNAVASGAQIVSTDYPFPLLANNFVPAEITSGFVVNIPVQCNPALISGCDAPVQSNVTVTPSRTLTGEGVFNFEGDFLNNIRVDNRTFALINEYADLLGINVTEYEPPSYTPLPYRATSNVNTLHSTARIGSTNEFQYDDMNYWKGLIIIAGVFLILSFIFLIFAYFWFFKCCCTCRKSNFKKRSKRTNIILLSITVVLFIAAITGCILAFIGVGEFVNALEESKELMKDTESIFQTVANLGPDVGRIATALSSSLTLASTTCPEFLSGKATEVTNILDEITNFANDISGETGSIPNSVDDAEGYITQAQSIIKGVVVTFVVFVMLAIIGLIVCLCFSPVLNKRATERKIRINCSKYCLIPVSVLLIFITMVLFALILTLSILMADVCHDVDNTVLSVLPSSAEEVAGSFLTCNNTGNNKYTSFFDDEFGIVMRAIDLEPMYNLTALVCPDDSTAADFTSTINNEMIPALASIRDTIIDLTELLSCYTITPLYERAVHRTLCTTTTDGLTYLWVGLIMIIITMSLLICSFGAIAITSIEDMDDFKQMKSNDEMLEVNREHTMDGDSKADMVKSADADSNTIVH